jgi:protein tyrosine phosphatase (PTP) superfamily phosphohydrolase (DUF442 family)
MQLGTKVLLGCSLSLLSAGCAGVVAYQWHRPVQTTPATLVSREPVARRQPTWRGFGELPRPGTTRSSQVSPRRIEEQTRTRDWSKGSVGAQPRVVEGPLYLQPVPQSSTSTTVQEPPRQTPQVGQNRHDTGLQTQQRAYPAEPQQTGRWRITRQTVPGLAGYVAIQPNVAYGLQPEPEGLRWLKRRSFVAVLDLNGAEADPAEGPMLRQLGLHYINLPFDPKTFGHALVQEFSAVYTNPKYRPLYIHDRDGARFSALWILHRVVQDKQPVDVPLKELEEMGIDGRQSPLWPKVQELLKATSAPPPQGSPGPSLR